MPSPVPWRVDGRRRPRRGSVTGGSAGRLRRVSRRWRCRLPAGGARTSVGACRGEGARARTGAVRQWPPPRGARVRRRLSPGCAQNAPPLSTGGRRRLGRCRRSGGGRCWSDRVARHPGAAAARRPAPAARDARARWPLLCRCVAGVLGRRGGAPARSAGDLGARPSSAGRGRDRAPAHLGGRRGRRGPCRYDTAHEPGAPLWPRRAHAPAAWPRRCARPAVCSGRQRRRGETQGGQRARRWPHRSPLKKAAGATTGSGHVRR